MKSLQEQLAAGEVLISDGAMGALLQAKGMARRSLRSLRVRRGGTHKFDGPSAADTRAQPGI